jgi:hypothetical protein
LSLAIVPKNMGIEHGEYTDSGAIDVTLTGWGDRRIPGFLTFSWVKLGTDWGCSGVLG